MKRILPLALAVLLLGGVGVHHYQNQLEPDEALAKGELLSINQLKIRQIETLSEERLLAAALAGMLVLMGLLGYALQTRQRYLRSRHSLDEEIEYRRGEQRFHDLFDQMPEPVWIVRGTRFIEANSAAMAAIGYARRPDFLDLHPGEVSPEFQPDGLSSRQKAEEMVRIAQKEGVHRFEWVHQRVDGSVFPVEVTLTTMEWEGQPAICCIWRDISERQALWQRVQASEARFRALFESSNDAILLESGQAFLDCNPRALQLFGLESREQLVGLHPADLSPTLLPDGRDAKSAADAFVREAIETGRCLFEWTSRKCDGSLFPSEVLLSSFRLGDEVFLQARVRDLTDEQRAMRNLRDSEARFRTLFESSNDAIMLLKDGCFEDCNEKTLQLFGFSGKEAIIGRRPDALSPDLQPDGQASATLAVARYQQAVAEGEAHFEWRHRRADGREFPADILLSRYRMGEAVWIQATVRDITELKAAEAALRASEANLRRAQAVANVGSWTLEVPEDRLVWSEQTYRIFGVEPGMPLTYEDFVQFIHPEDRARVEQVWQAALQGAPYSIEHRILVNGEERWVQEQADLRFDEHGGLVAGIGTVQDITPRKQAELALQSLNQELERRVAERTAELENLSRHLRASEAAALSQSQRLRDVIWGADIGTWELHVPSGQVVLSERWASMLGYSLAELEPTRIDTWRQLTEPTDLQRAEAILKRCFARQLDHYECELRMRHKGGDWVWVLDRGRVVEWSTEGQPLRMSGTHQDITDRKRAEQAIRDLNRNLEQKVAERTAQLEVAGRAKSEFLANMSHEIRTPMNAILGLAQLLEREPLSADQRDLLRKIKDSGQCLLHVINDVLDFSKIEAGQLKLENQPFELAPVLFRLESLLGHLAQEKALILDVNPPVGVPGRLLGDPLRIGQVLLNLASNAVKSTERGRVTVRVRVLSASTSACRLRFEVRDTGIGIEPDTLDRLFQPFTQADASTTRRFGGTGLGLSISKHLVERMGGRIGAESTPGQGSLFWFELPLERSEAGQQGESTEFPPLDPVAPKPMSRQPRLFGLRILAVDDNRMNLFLLERMLRGEGAEVGLCADGQQAVETLKASPSAYDVVLMDIQMPVMDGIAATRALRLHPATAALPVFALTAGVLPEERDFALAAGMNDFLGKPVDLEQLVAKLQPYALSDGDTAVTSPDVSGMEGPSPPGTEAVITEWPVIPGIDSGRARLLSGHDRAFFLKMLGMFVEEFASLRSELIAHMAAGDRESASRRIHNLKGNAGNLGAIELMELAKAAEIAIHNQQSDEAQAVERLHLALDTLINECRPCLSQFASSAIPALASLSRRRLGELRTALLQHNLAALGLFAELEPAIAAACGARTADTMATAMRHLKFEDALSTLDAAFRRD